MCEQEKVASAGLSRSRKQSARPELPRPTRADREIRIFPFKFCSSRTDCFTPNNDLLFLSFAGALPPYDIPNVGVALLVNSQ